MVTTEGGHARPVLRFDRPPSANEGFVKLPCRRSVETQPFRSPQTLRERHWRGAPLDSRPATMPEPMTLLKGTLDVLVLKALSWGPMHGFEITCWLEDRSESQLTVDDSALYQALHRMEERDLIVGEWGVTENNRRARFYRMTANGRAHLRAEAASLVRYASTVTSILEARAR